MNISMNHTDTVYDSMEIPTTTTTITNKKEQSSYENELLRLIRLKNWINVIRYVQQYPNSTVMTTTIDSTTTASTTGSNTIVVSYITTSIVYAIRNGCSCIRTLGTILKANRKQIIIVHYNSGTLFHDILHYYYCLLKQQMEEQQQHRLLHQQHQQQQQQYLYHSNYDDSIDSIISTVGKLLVFFLHQLKQYYKYNNTTTSTSSTCSSTFTNTIQTFLCTKDNFGRTIIHTLCEFIILYENHILATTTTIDTDGTSSTSTMISRSSSSTSSSSSSSSSSIESLESSTSSSYSTSTTAISKSIFQFFVDIINICDNTNTNNNIDNNVNNNNNNNETNILRFRNKEQLTSLIVLLQSQYYLRNSHNNNVRNISSTSSGSSNDIPSHSNTLSDRMIQYIIQKDPYCVLLSNTLYPISATILSNTTNTTTTSSTAAATTNGSYNSDYSSSSRDNISNTRRMKDHNNNYRNENVVPIHNTPLYYAILYRRSVSIITIIVDAMKVYCLNNNKNNTSSSNNIEQTNDITFISPYHETYIHLCITCRSSIDIVQIILSKYPYSVLSNDIFGLSSIDWLWLCYVVDTNNYIDSTAATITVAVEEQGRQFDVTMTTAVPDYHFDRIVLQEEENEYVNTTNANSRHMRRRRIISSTSSCYLLSRRRYLGGSLLNQWLHNTENDIISRLASTNCDQTDEILLQNTDNQYKNQRRDYMFQYLIERLNVLLPIAAEVTSYLQQKQMQQQQQKQNEKIIVVKNDWLQHCTLIHAACYVRCPTMILIASALATYTTTNNNSINNDNNKQTTLIDNNNQSIAYCDKQILNFLSTVLCTRDERLLRYPLHYAACRQEQFYSVQYPVHEASSSIRIDQRNYIKSSPIVIVLPFCINASRIYDSDNRLPLHILLDTMKNRYNQHDNNTNNNNDTTMYQNNITDNSINDEQEKQQEYDCNANDELYVIQQLINANPLSLQIRDGKTKLYPFQQAAIGVGSNFSTIYYLLRKDPSLLILLPQNGDNTK